MRVSVIAPSPYQHRAPAPAETDPSVPSLLAVVMRLRASWISLGLRPAFYHLAQNATTTTHALSPAFPSPFHCRCILLPHPSPPPLLSSFLLRYYSLFAFRLAILSSRLSWDFHLLLPVNPLRYLLAISEALTAYSPGPSAAARIPISSEHYYSRPSTS